MRLCVARQALSPAEPSRAAPLSDVLRLLLFIVMLLAPDFSGSEPENAAAKPVQPAFAFGEHVACSHTSTAT